ncbi:unnamed protein product [Sphagnum compactum]
MEESLLEYVLSTVQDSNVEEAVNKILTTELDVLLIEKAASLDLSDRPTVDDEEINVKYLKEAGEETWKGLLDDNESIRQANRKMVYRINLVREDKANNYDSDESLDGKEDAEMEDARLPPALLTVIPILRNRFASNPGIFERSQRNSLARKNLLEETKLTHEQIEGWARTATSPKSENNLDGSSYLSSDTALVWKGEQGQVQTEHTDAKKEKKAVTKSTETYVTYSFQKTDSEEVDLSEYSTFLSLDDINQLSCLDHPAPVELLSFQMDSEESRMNDEKEKVEFHSMVSGYRVVEISAIPLQSCCTVNLFVVILQIMPLEMIQIKGELHKDGDGEGIGKSRILVWVGDSSRLFFPVCIWNVENRVERLMSILKPGHAVLWTNVYVKAFGSALGGHASFSSKMIQYGPVDGDSVSETCKSRFLRSKGCMVGEYLRQMENHGLQIFENK